MGGQRVKMKTAASERGAFGVMYGKA